MRCAVQATPLSLIDAGRPFFFLNAPIPNAVLFPWCMPGGTFPFPQSPNPECRFLPLVGTAPPSFLFPFRAFRVFRCCSSASKAPRYLYSLLSTLYSLLSTLSSVRCVQYIICSRARLCRVKNILQLFCEKTCTVRKIAVPLHPQNERGPCEGKPEWRPPEVFCARPWGGAAFFDRLTRDECSTGKDKKRTVIL